MMRVKLCNSLDLKEGGHGQRFKVLMNNEKVTAFVLRVDNQLVAYLNRCAHLPVEMDWNRGDFLDESGQVIVCASHGASYDALNGNCLGGPCGGNPLVRLDVEEHLGEVFWNFSKTIAPDPDGIED